ncbi:hypothetical protein Pfo_008768 [Paulownia fortunei]|nr:hypothetical protein Pfo_008768 [Paulownia fortunei]
MESGVKQNRGYCPGLFQFSFSFHISTNSQTRPAKSQPQAFLHTTFRRRRLISDKLLWAFCCPFLCLLHKLIKALDSVRKQRQGRRKKDFRAML